MRRFKLTFSMYGQAVDTAIIELDDEVVDAVDDEWRAQFYNLCTPEQIAARVGYSLIVDRLLLSELDGWADQPSENARVVEWPDLDQWDVEVEEVKDAAR